MIKTYNLLDGGTITATSPEDFVTQLVRAAVLIVNALIRSSCRTLLAGIGNCMVWI